MTLVKLRVCGFHWVWGVAVGFDPVLLFAAAAAAALDLEAWVSLVGSSFCWFASTPARAIQVAFAVTKSS